MSSNVLPLALASPPPALRAMLLLRLLYLGPGAMSNGMLAIALPWILVGATSTAAAMGLLTGGWVAAAVAGAWLGRSVARRWGARVASSALSLLSVLMFGLASLAWLVWDAGAWAYAAVILASACDAGSDLVVQTRWPLLARLVRQPLARVLGANWLWTIGGTVLGALLAGWAMEQQALWAVAAVIAICGAVGAAALRCVLPHDRRLLTPPRAAWQEMLAIGLLLRRRRLLAGVLGALLLAALALGPIDQLFVPILVARAKLGADFLGLLSATAALGAALGLGLSHQARLERLPVAVLAVGTGAVAGYLLLWWAAPAAPGLLVGTFVVSLLATPMLPLLEAIFVRGMPPGLRPTFMAAMVAGLGLADALGGVLLGRLFDLLGPALVLLALAVLCAAAALGLASGGARLLAALERALGTARNDPGQA